MSIIWILVSAFVSGLLLGYRAGEYHQKHGSMEGFSLWSYDETPEETPEVPGIQSREEGSQ
jgi:hypothetical protein